MWDNCGMARNAAGLQRGAAARFPQLREEFWRNVNVPGSDAELNQALEKAGRVADFLELGELMCLDALHREESCGGHFREEYQTADGEAHARRRAVRLRGGVGIRRRRPAAPCCTRSRWTSSTCIWPSGATSERPQFHPPRLAAGRPGRPGGMVGYEAHDISPDMSFLEMLDVVNERLDGAGRGADRLRPRLPGGDLRHLQPDDQRRGARSQRRAPPPASSTCGASSDGDDDHDRAVAGEGVSRWSRIWWWTGARWTGSFSAGGYITAPTGGAPDGNAILIPKETVDTAMDAAQCIGCGACVAACPNASASLFTAAKMTHLGLLPQGQPERIGAPAMVRQMDLEGFGGCTLYGECQDACPKEISIDTITRMNPGLSSGRPDGRARGGGRVRLSSDER